MVISHTLSDPARQMIKRSGGRAELLMHYAASKNYEVWGCNDIAGPLFGIDPERFKNGPMPWGEIRPDVAKWLVEAFKHAKGAVETDMPDYIHAPEGGSEILYKVKMYYQSSSALVAGNRVDEMWYFFCFSTPTAPLVLPPPPPAPLVLPPPAAVAPSGNTAGGAVTWIDGEQHTVNQQKLETIGELASGVAHDFNNLIMGIQSNAEALLPQEHLHERDKEIIISIIRACSTGSSLTRSLLGYAKKQPLALVRFNMVDMISDVARIAGLTSKNNTTVVLGPEFSDKNKEIEVVACFSSLSHCLLNLIKNAREAMPNGGNVSVLWKGDETTANVTVQDQGIGMAPETLKHIFEPFFSTKKQGTGLGLAMVRGIMSQHNGTVEIRSEVGKGTQVSLVWPRFGKETNPTTQTGSIRPEEPRKSTQQLLKQTATVPSPIGDGKKPLAYVVDDDDLVRDGLVGLMQILGHEVKSFSKPQEAIVDLKSTPNPPKVLITDYNMPLMTGEQLIGEYCDFAKGNPAHANVRILLMSGLPPSHFQDFMARYKMMNLGTLEKPFSLETLRNKVQNVQSLRKMTTMIGVVKPSKEMKHFVPRISTPGA